MKLLKILTSSLLLFCVLLSSGCFLSKAGNYVADKSKSAYGATKSALGFDQDSE
jgi:hypothetical protein